MNGLWTQIYDFLKGTIASFFKLSYMSYPIENRALDNQQSRAFICGHFSYKLKADTHVLFT